MKKQIDKNLYELLKAISEGYITKGYDDQFVVVQNPKTMWTADPDNLIICINDYEPIQ